MGRSARMPSLAYENIAAIGNLAVSYAGIYPYDEYDRKFPRNRAEQFRQQVNPRPVAEAQRE